MKIFQKIILFILIGISIEVTRILIKSILLPNVGCLLFIPSIFLIYLFFLLIFNYFLKTEWFKNFIQLFLMYFLGYLMLNIYWDFIDLEFYSKKELIQEFIIVISCLSIIFVYFFKNFKLKLVDYYWSFFGIIIYISLAYCDAF